MSASPAPRPFATRIPATVSSASASLRRAPPAGASSVAVRARSSARPDRDERQRQEHDQREREVDREEDHRDREDREDCTPPCGRRRRVAGRQLRVVRRTAHQLAGADAVVKAGVELERAGEERVTNGGASAWRGSGSRRSASSRPRLASISPRPHEPAAPEEERVVVLGEDPVVDRALDDERWRRPRPARRGRRRSRRARLGARGRRGARRSACLLFGGGGRAWVPAQSCRVSRRRSASCSSTGHTLAERVDPPPIEERFPRPSVMGVVNVTPDSFSDGGVHLQADDAIAAARRMVADGAAIVDVGGESTRPGSEGVSLDEELRRVVPVLEAVARRASVSIDTAKAGGRPARARAGRGARERRDGAPRRPGARGVVADAGAYLCLMHMQGEPRTMQATRATTTSPPRSPRSWRSGSLRRRSRVPEDADLPRPGDRLRQDGRAQLRAAAPARRARLARPAGRRRLLAQALARPTARRSRRDDGPALREPRGRRRGVRARRDDPPRPRRPRARRGADGRRARSSRDRRSSCMGSSCTASTACSTRSASAASASSSTSARRPRRRRPTLEDAVDYRDVGRTCARSRTATRSTCSRRSPRPSRTSCSSASPSSACASAFASPTSSSTRRSSTRPLRRAVEALTVYARRAVRSRGQGRRGRRSAAASSRCRRPPRRPAAARSVRAGSAPRRRAAQGNGDARRASQIDVHVGVGRAVTHDRVPPARSDAVDVLGVLGDVEPRAAIARARPGVR